MVPVLSLWLPIVLSAVIVFVASSIIHMALPFHRSDLRKVAREDDLLKAFRGLNMPPGDYAMPHAGSMAGMKKPEFIEKMKAGPVVLMTIAPGGSTAMGSRLALWFVYSVVISIVAAYVTGRALGPGAHYLEVFRFAGCVSFTGYSLSLPQTSIWYRRSWITTIKVMIDGLIYGLLTAGVFGWLWPR